MKKAELLVIGALSLVVLLIAACGGGDDATSTSTSPTATTPPPPAATTPPPPAATATSPPAATATSAPLPTSPPSDGLAAQGKAIFLTAPDSVGIQPLWCLLCHKIEGVSEGVLGPDLTRIGTDAATRKPGTSAEDYIRESIVAPTAFVAEGVERATPGLMTDAIVAGLTDDQVNALVAFLLEQK